MGWENPAPVGIGDPEARLRVYLANRPPLAPYDHLDHMHPLAKGEIADIVAGTGNHWRKIFNLYAKLMYSLDGDGYVTWQSLRDECLLQKDSGTALLFSVPVVWPGSAHRQVVESTCTETSDLIQVVMGKQYADSLKIAEMYPDWHPVSADFMLSREGRVIGCPYFDYRQLSNEKLARLVELIQALK